MRREEIAGSRTAVWRYFAQHQITVKKSTRATDQRRADVARARRRWMLEQGLFKPVSSRGGRERETDRKADVRRRMISRCNTLRCCAAPSHEFEVGATLLNPALKAQCFYSAFDSAGNPSAVKPRRRPRHVQEMYIRHDRNANNRPFRAKYSVGAGDAKLSTQPGGESP
jgi:hypothetical protein